MPKTNKRMGPVEAYVTGVAKVVTWLAPSVVSAIVTAYFLRKVFSENNNFGRMYQ